MLKCTVRVCCRSKTSSNRRVLARKILLNCAVDRAGKPTRSSAVLHITFLSARSGSFPFRLSNRYLRGTLCPHPRCVHLVAFLSRVAVVFNKWYPMEVGSTYSSFFTHVPAHKCSLGNFGRINLLAIGHRGPDAVMIGWIKRTSTV